MKILLTGATGFIGGHLLKKFKKEGHELILVTRSKNISPEISQLISSQIQWDLNEGPIENFEQKLGASSPIDAVIHLAGESIAQLWTPIAKTKIRNSRIESSLNLFKSFENSKLQKPKVFILTSAIGIYGDRQAELLLESSQYGDDFLAQVCKDWEATSESFKKTMPESRFVHLRFGLVLGKDGGIYPKLKKLFSNNLGAPLGRGVQWMSWIHIDDLVEIINFSIHNPNLHGPINAASPSPVQNREFTKLLAKSLHRISLPAVPQFLLKLGLQEMSSLLLYSQRVVPGELVKEGFHFKFTDLKEALEDLKN